jgi:hypothetical protein
MGSMMKHMSIGPKFILSISLVALIVIGSASPCCTSKKNPRWTRC